MTSSRTEWPSTPVASPIKNLLSSFFVLGDTNTPEAGKRLGEEIFSTDGQIVVNKKTINGAAEIASSNHGLLQGLQSRKHDVQKVYSCNEVGDDLMLIGTVTWTFKNGQKKDGGFAAKALIEGADSEQPRLKLYQGWADLSEMMEGLSQQQSASST